MAAPITSQGTPAMSWPQALSVLGISSVLFSAGVFVGRQDVREELAEIRGSAAVAAAERASMRLQFEEGRREVERRLGRVEALHNGELRPLR